jgi:hypothetical protein
MSWFQPVGSPQGFDFWSQFSTDTGRWTPIACTGLPAPGSTYGRLVADPRQAGTLAATYRFREGIDNGGLGRPAAESPAARAGIIGHHAPLDGRDSNSILHRPGAPQQEIPRPSTAPAYYLGRPARLWITAISPLHRRSWA